MKDTNPKTQFGVAKPSLTSVPPVALFMIGQAMENGAAKYGPANWRKDPVSISTYVNAVLRHLFEFWDGEDTDMESLLPHLAHAAANLCILMDAEAQGTLIDDRLTPGRLTTFLKHHTKGIKNEVF